MSFPEDPLDIRVQAYLQGEWIDFGPIVSIVDDFYTDEYIDEYLGRLSWDLRRLPEQELTITQGRIDEASTVNPASVSLLLWNDDGWLTPGNPDSPWTDWDLNCRLRILVEGEVRFWGEVSDIRVEWSLGDLSRVEDAELDDLASVPIERLGFTQVSVTASGVLRRLNQRTKPLRSCLFRRVTSPSILPSVVDYFPMEDGSDTSRITSGIPNRRSMAFAGTMQFASDDTLDGSEPLPVVPQGKTANWFANVEGFNGTGVVQMWMRMPQRPDEFTTFRPIEVRCNGDHANFSVEIIRYNGLPHMQVRSYNASGTLTNQSRVFLDDQVFWRDWWITLRFTLTEAGGDTTWAISWGKVTREVDIGFGYSGTWAGTFGHVTAIGGGAFQPPGDGIAVGHYVVHHLPNAWQVGPDIGMWGEEARTRIQRLCSEEAIPLSIVSGIDNRSTKMGPQRALAFEGLLQECATADRGILAEQVAGFGLVYVHRRSRYNQDPQLTLDAAGSEIANPFQPVRDDQLIRNDVVAQRLNGSSAREMNAESMDHFGVYDEQITINNSSDLLLRHVAGWQLRLGASNGIRVAELTLDLAVAPHKISDWQAIARPGVEVRVLNLPPQFGAESIDLIIQGWSEQISSDRWTVTLNATPADPWKIAKWNDAAYPWDAPQSILGL